MCLHVILSPLIDCWMCLFYFSCSICANHIFQHYEVNYDRLLQRMNLEYTYGISECQRFPSKSFLDIHTGIFKKLSLRIRGVFSVAFFFFFYKMGHISDTYYSIVAFPNTGRTWAVTCNPEYDGLILVSSLSLSPLSLFPWLILVYVHVHKIGIITSTSSA